MHTRLEQVDRHKACRSFNAVVVIHMSEQAPHSTPAQAGGHKRLRSEVSPIIYNQNKMSKLAQPLPVDSPPWAKILLDELSGKIDNLSEKIEEIKYQAVQDHKKIEDLEEENTRLSQEVNHLKLKSEEYQDKILRLESLPRQKQLLVHGLDENTWETEAQTEEKICEYFESSLQLDPKEIVFDRVHRLGQRISAKTPNKARPRPILVSFLRGKDRQKVWTA